MAAVSTGIPGWADLGSPDMDATRTFYTELFGWTANVSPDPQYGGYTLFTLDGKTVAGAGPLMAEGQPPAWAVYVLVNDADAIEAKVAAAKGHTMLAPFQVGDQGRMAIFADPTGAAISVWEPATMAGADTWGENGSVAWTELLTRDPDAAVPFYGSVFGWTAVPAGPGYSAFTLGGAPFGGLRAMTPDMFPADIPPHWGVYFAVEDCEESAATVTKLGGTLLVPPSSGGPGVTFAQALDTTGAAFTIRSFSA